MAGKRILLIDDERVIHTFLQALLAREGFSVNSAYDALQGPLIARNTRPDLVILDIAMPGGGGYKVFERLRAMPGTARVPVLVYSAVPKSHVEQQIHEAADVAFLEKPAAPEEIVATVKKLLAG
jgi:DNA-binding response OmpR family regulator